MSVCISKKRTTILTCFEEQWGAGKILVATDWAKSVRETPSTAKLKSWAAWILNSAFNAKRGKSQWTAWCWFASLGCFPGHHLAALAKELYFQSHTNSNSRLVEVIIGIVSLQCRHSSFPFPFSEQTLIWLLMK